MANHSGLPRTESFLGVELSVLEKEEAQVSWGELVTLNLEEKLKCCLESLYGASIWNLPATVNLNAQASQYCRKLLWISYSINLEFWGLSLEPGQRVLLYSSMF